MPALSTWCIMGKLDCDMGEPAESSEEFFYKLDEMAIMPILASEASLHENKKNPVTKCYPNWVLNQFR